MEKIGIEAERVAMYNLSAGEGPRFAEIAREMTEKVRDLGPSPIKNAKKLASKKSEVEVAA